MPKSPAKKGGAATAASAGAGQPAPPPTPLGPAQGEG